MDIKKECFKGKELTTLFKESTDTFDFKFGKYNTYPLNKNDVARLITATGGGYGNPLKRPMETVLMYVKNEYITIEQAENNYGVLINPSTLTIDDVTSERIEKEQA